MRRLLVFFFALAASAHVGSPDVFYESNAGPYHLLITVRPPVVVPGVAEIEVRTSSDDVQQIHIVPLRLGVAIPQFTPTPDLAQRSKDYPHFYTGALWLMNCCSWQVRIDVDGTEGHGTLAVPVPALATRMLGMQKATGGILIALGVLLCIGLVSIAGAAVRDGTLEAGKQPDPVRIRNSRITMALTALILAGAVYFGNQWWASDAGDYARFVYKPLRLDPTVEGSRLTLKLTDPGWINRRTDDLLPDHDHLMHLYMIRVPDMNYVWHLHPERQEDSTFVQQLPSMPAGRYALYGDIVHANGVPETATAELNVPDIVGSPLAGDDAGGAIDAPSAYHIVWDRPSAPIHAKRADHLRFRVEDASGHPASDVQLYMGMLGHAAIVARDGTVFAHIHPSGSAPMAAVQLTQPNNPHAGHTMMSGSLPAEVAFPYGFPKSGDYRIIVQVKRGGAILTGAFDAKVEP